MENNPPNIAAPQQQPPPEGSGLGVVVSDSERQVAELRGEIERLKSDNASLRQEAQQAYERGREDMLTFVGRAICAKLMKLMQRDRLKKLEMVMPYLPGELGDMIWKLTDITSSSPTINNYQFNGNNAINNGDGSATYFKR